MLQIRDIDQELLGVTFYQWRPIWRVIHCVVVFHLIVLDFGCWTVETEKQTHTIWKQIYMSANNINVIISGTTAIVQVWFVDPWATNNTFHWLNWTPLVNWYAFKIRPRNLEIEHFSSLPKTCILTDCSSSRTLKWHNKDSIFQPCFFTENTWRNLLDFLVERVFVLSIFIATAYDILLFSTISEIKK